MSECTFCTPDEEERKNLIQWGYSDCPQVGKIFNMDFAELNIGIDDSTLISSSEGILDVIGISYCPFCGRKLSEVQE